jgi:superfamily I DNA/RNA helicase
MRNTTFEPTPEQTAIIDADLDPQCVVACPGSGKTATAVRRVLEVRRRLQDTRGYVLLLSYSNVAVDTFHKEYNALAQSLTGVSARVRIDTVDAFLTTYILRPHASRVMRAKRQPFLVSGSEAFLNNYTIYDGKYPRAIQYLTVSLRGDDTLEYCIREDSAAVQVDARTAESVITRLGQTGAYTHELGRYWALNALAHEPKLLNVLAKRFTHIIVDEAQDVGSLHGALLTLLSQAGSTVSLVGDPNQAIFEFAGANGNFLRSYENRGGVKPYPLGQNRRSVGSIVNVANQLAGTASTPFRTATERRHGAYYVRYDSADLAAALALFESVLEASGYGADEAVILCRGRPYVARLTGQAGEVGTGATELLAQAAVLRDRSGDIAFAFEKTVSGVMRLLNNTSPQLRSEVIAGAEDPEVKAIRRLVWRFLRDTANGLPLATLKAQTEWHPRLKIAVGELLATVERSTSLARSSSWANNLTKRKLLDEPLWEADLTNATNSKVRVDTVHKAKGEGIAAVMYLARTEDINALVHGTGTEEGRIGYVAITRARDLLILGVPTTAKPAVIAAIEGKGFKPWRSEA